MKSSDYHDHQFFEPADPAEHEASNEGRDYKGQKSYDLKDYCRNCSAPMLDHFNGRCPK